MFTAVNSKVVSVNLAQSGPIVARRGAMLFYTGQVYFEPHQVPGGGGGMGGGMMGGMAGRMLSGEHEATMLAQGNGVVHYGFRGIEATVVNLGSVGGQMRVEASRLLARTADIQASIVSVASSGGQGGGGGGGLFGSLRNAAAGAMTGQGMFTTQLMGAGSVVVLGHGGIFELPVNPGGAVLVDPQAFVASAGQVNSTLKSAMSWRNVGRGGGESMQLECTGQGVVYVQASEQKM
ncbi:AIM24 family protein [Gordonia sp. (in: high G+C Gram-positive bacteria)]|uniref:AIM24 family protein n=1 Tax=Gordonia sp. (in: high G+C Gram-positive bacteria) TaxID=84139 RepID=UPI001DBFF0C7|nr:AIM24 family protein [Gordonia sp. (in: high G+C Gram-positive bacteria)]MCB1296733.1 AIM24 family protein [Gordonia sp. (in: high G+C Gram-positive bacteria)]HMS74709.1 AIM24 family protein [Gordonia sp. (in: high G+C Gram-positive bacteria)]